MRRIRHWVFLGGLALALTGGGYYALYESGTSPAAKQVADDKADGKNREKGVTVEAARVAVETVVDAIQTVGTLRPNEAVIVSPEIAGRIARMPFSEGDRVEAGATLVELDSAILRAELDKARAEFRLATANRDRATTLARRGTGTLRARDEAIATYGAAQANLALAEARLEKATITAALTGIVGIRSVSVGAYVSPGDRIVELADTDPIKVDFRVPELALPVLRTGQSIRVTVDAFPGEAFEGKIYVIDPIVDANGRAIRLRARIPNPEYRLSPGLFARVRIVVERREMAILIPESAVFAEGETRYVYRIVDGRAVRTEVEFGQRRPGQIEILAGLDRGSVVVTAGHQQIRNGSRVTIAAAGKGA